MTRHAPYGDTSASAIYHLLFADDATAFAPHRGEAPAPWQDVLSGTDAAAVRVLADDATQESRVRALAFGWLRAHGVAVSAKVLLGVVVEVPLDGGLDTLAAYADGSVRYINQSGAMSIFDAPMPALAPQVDAVLRAAQAIVARIGPTDGPRLPPPAAGNLRLSFLVSDGLYFGEGPADALMGDALAGPLVNAATGLLQAVVAVPHGHGVR
ncbi:MAG: hypothetical protein U1F10_02130 [Burkholderiales bacterium]